jgi:hypothetical protein
MNDPHDDIRTVARRFVIPGDVVDIAPFTAGHIHSTFCVTCEGGARFLLQRVNTDIFTDPASLMGNIQRVIDHVRDKLIEQGRSDIDRRVLNVIATCDTGEPIDALDASHGDGGAVWRMYRFIEHTRTDLLVTMPDQARTAGAAFGRFQTMLADLPADRLAETLPGFHDTPKRLDTLHEAADLDAHGREEAVAEEIDFILGRADIASFLLDELASGALPLRIAHNDAKITNVLLDADSGEALCVIDLDTVMPGTILYDFGDMVRSMTTGRAEDDPDGCTVGVRPDLFAALVEGYLPHALFLTPRERELLVDGAIIITLEQAARFLTDYLEGDTYYATHRPNQNLDRARAQIAIVRSLERQRIALERMIDQASGQS